MVQVGSSMDQEHQAQGSRQDQPWTHLINDAVKDFVQAITESTRQLATAAERFAGDSLSLIDDATTTAKSSAAISSEMAEAAKKAASDAQRAAESLQGAVSEAGEQIRNETRNNVDEALARAREAQQASERTKAEIQQQAEDYIQRIERSSEGSQEVIRAAQRATDEVRQAAEHVSETAGSVDAAVNAAREAAEQARSAAERAEAQAGDASASALNMQQALQEARGISARIQENVVGMDGIVKAAQSAAKGATAAAGLAESTAMHVETSVIEVRAIADQTREVVAHIDETTRNATSAAESAQQAAIEAARRADEASAEPKLGPQADTLLERLENDYQLLTSLVQELASRISSMANVAASQMESEEEAPDEASAWESTEAPPLESYESAISYESTAEVRSEEGYFAEVSLEPEIKASAASEGPDGFNPEWIETTISYPTPVVSESMQSEPVAEIPSWQQETTVEAPAAELEASPLWRAVESDVEAPQLDAWTPEAQSIASTPEQQIETPEWSPSDKEAPSEASAAVSTEEPTLATAPHSTLFGRVQVNISPVPDFDRLLSLDSALSRVSSVQTVTLADYAQEEVTFRIDLASPLEAADFAQQLGEAAGLNTEVAEANSSAVTVRLA